MNAKRCYFICLFVFLLYVSLTVHEIADVARTNDLGKAGSPTELLNRSVVASKYRHDILAEQASYLSEK